MALIVCPECQKEISDMAAVCPNCGYPLKTPESTLNESPVGFAKLSAKTKKIIAGALAIIVVILIASFSMNANERLALAACKKLKATLKDPNSFVLYEDIAIYEDGDDSKDQCMAIDFGAANSYGGMVRKTAIFCEGKYLGDMGDEESDFSSQQEYDQFVLAGAPYKFASMGLNWDGNADDMKFVSYEKIMKKLN